MLSRATLHIDGQAFEGTADVRPASNPADGWRPRAEADVVIDVMIFPDRFLRGVRERAGLFLGEAARRLSLSVVELSAIETGKVAPRISTVRAMEGLYRAILVRDDMGPGGAA